MIFFQLDKMKNFISLLLYFILICSCNKEQEVESNSDNDSIINIDVSSTRLLENDSLSNLISSYEYVALETNENSLMGGVTSLVVRDDRIFIHDEITKSLLVFDRAGKFILRIEAIGEGPKSFLNW